MLAKCDEKENINDFFLEKWSHNYENYKLPKRKKILKEEFVNINL